MSVHCGYVVKVQNLRPHINADKLQIASFFGNDTCVGLDVKIGDIGIYFPSDIQLSIEFAEKNNLLRKKDENGNNIGGYMDPQKRNVTAIKLRGEKSDGLFLPLESLKDFGDISTLKEGDIVSTFNGHEIACKYIPKANYKKVYNEKTNKTRKKKVPIAPLFAEHADTEQLAYNLSAFKPGDEIEISLKMHGTSQRTGYLPTLKGYKRSIWDKIFRKEGNPIYEYDYISGTRRTVLENYEGGFYGDNHFRQQHHDKFVGKLMKGETVYYEVVGFTDSGAPIMGNGKNEKLGKDFVKQYGKETVFSYGCSPAEITINASYFEGNIEEGIVKEVPQSECYVYRMTMTNEDGFVVEYSPDFMRYRCDQMGVKCVPIFWKGFIPSDFKTEDFITNEMGEFEDWYYANNAGEWVKNKTEQFYDGPDPVGKTHIREGVVVRIVNRPKFTAFKHKNFSFKLLEGIIKDSASAPDMEEAQEI